MCWPESIIELTWQLKCYIIMKCKYFACLLLISAESWHFLHPSTDKELHFPSRNVVETQSTFSQFVIAEYCYILVVAWFAELFHPGFHTRRYVAPHVIALHYVTRFLFIASKQLKYKFKLLMCQESAKTKNQYICFHEHSRTKFIIDTDETGAFYLSRRNVTYLRQINNKTNYLNLNYYRHSEINCFRGQLTNNHR